MVLQDNGSWLDTPVGDNRTEVQQLCGPSMGDICWYNEVGEIHRLDGPAHERWNGDMFWYINDTEYFFKDWITLAPISDVDKARLILKYG